MEEVGRSWLNSSLRPINDGAGRTPGRRGPRRRARRSVHIPPHARRRDAITSFGNNSAACPLLAYDDVRSFPWALPRPSQPTVFFTSAGRDAISVERADRAAPELQQLQLCSTIDDKDGPPRARLGTLPEGRRRESPAGRAGTRFHQRERVRPARLQGRGQVRHTTRRELN